MTHGVLALLREHRDEIADSWAKLVRSERSDASDAALRAVVPRLLNELTGWLQSGEPAADARLDTGASKQLVGRGVDDGLEVARVLREYQLLREAIFRVVVDVDDPTLGREGAETGPATRIVELARLNAALDAALSRAVADLLAERDRRAATDRSGARPAAEDQATIQRPHESASFQAGVVVKDSPSWRASMRDAFVQVDMQGRITDFNEAYRAMLGYPAEELRASTYQQLTPQRWRAREADVVRDQVLTRGYSDLYEKECVRKDGTLLPIEQRTVLVRDDDGRPTAMWAIVRDLSERKRAEALSDALGEIDLVIHSSHDLDRIVQTALEKATTALGTETAAVSLREGAAWIVRHVHGLPAEVIGSRMVDDEEPHAILALRHQRPVAISDAWNDDRVNREHMRRWNVRAVLVVPLVVRGEAIGVVFFNDHRGPRPLGDADVNFGAKFGAALSLAIENAHLFEELRQADRRKTEFLAVLSHELRNPLAAIRNSIVLLESVPADSDPARRAKDVLARQSAHLVRLVDDLLDLSRITHGKMVVELAPVDVRELVRRAYLDAKVLFDARGVDLVLSDTPEPLFVEADAARFAQMVGNLLTNALKFTPPGGLVVVRIARRGGACEVGVKDNGQGLDPADLERIFDPFEQAARTREGTTGLGLGLSLVKRLAAKHNGSVRARSDGPGRGAEFILELPLCASPAPARELQWTLDRGRSRPMNIVIVEDNEDAAATLADLLALGGHRVTTASTGEAGVSTVAAERPDVVICDVGLPDMSGWDVIRRIRASEEGERIFAVALTGYAQPADRDAALAAGFDAHLPKPPPLDELDALLRGAADAGRRGMGASHDQGPLPRGTGSGITPSS